MKHLSFVLLLTILSVSAMAQSAKVTVFCYVDTRGRIDYKNLPKVLPDSLKSLLIDPRKDYSLKEANDVLLCLSLNGWRLITIEGNATNFDTGSLYVLGKDIFLSDAARAQFSLALQGVEVK